MAETLNRVYTKPSDEAIVCAQGVGLPMSVKVVELLVCVDGWVMCVWIEDCVGSQNFRKVTDPRIPCIFKIMSFFWTPDPSYRPRLLPFADPTGRRST